MNPPSDEKQDLSEQLVDALNALFGVHHGFRATHAKGVVCEGVFAPAPNASSLSRAPHFQESVKATVRFSDTSGIPNVPDNDPLASPHGCAIRFHLPQGGNADIVAHSYNGFPVGTPEEFLTFLHALAASGPEAPKPTPIETFFGSHPRAAQFAMAPTPPPISFATESYFGVNAFRFTNGQGESRYGRYQIRPVAGEADLAEAEAAKQGPNYLFEELDKRLANGPVAFRLLVQLPNEGDPLNDASLVWPDDRPTVEIGVLTVTNRVADSDAAQRALTYNPMHLADGIEPSQDPILLARPGIYSVAVKRRQQ